MHCLVGLSLFVSFALPILVPLDPPEDIQAETFINNTLFVRVKWRPIRSDRVEGNLIGYKVFYRTGDSEFSTKAVGPDVFETNIHIVNDPQPYEIRVAAFTRGGIGPMSWSRQTQGKSKASLQIPY